jgi:hypothetical protein
MLKKTVVSLFSLVIAFSIIGCACSSQKKTMDLGTLQTAVESSASVVIGQYGAAIPSDFNGAKLMELVKGKIPSDYYEVLKEYTIEVKPLGAYYLLTVYSPGHKNDIILFDYSCTAQADGLVFKTPEKFELGHLEKYDPCK